MIQHEGAVKFDFHTGQDDDAVRPGDVGGAALELHARVRRKRVRTQQIQRTDPVVAVQPRPRARERRPLHRGSRRHEGEAVDAPARWCSIFMREGRHLCSALAAALWCLGVTKALAATVCCSFRSFRGCAQEQVCPVGSVVLTQLHRLLSEPTRLTTVTRLTNADTYFDS